ncbi:MAG TPA: orotidine-5'-phosphate decarboxylase [Planctomycetota bacterium]|nr:orotidine-5'-phosphate decarboxylase [Planctomycetota bacterium]
MSRLREKLAAGHAPVCVGIDPRLEDLPRRLLPDAAPPARIAAFCREVLPVLAPVVPAVKPNVAFFERWGSAGFAVYEEVCRRARALGLLVIGDVKRGDIGSTAEAYAALHLDLADAVTLHPLLGRDAVAPFLARCERDGSAVFVLVRTSNASAAELQGLRLEGGGDVSDAVARAVDAWGAGLGPPDDYGPVGAVVGATWPDDLARLRAAMPRALLLLPGVGAQGASIEDTLPAFDAAGFGALVNQSRGVLRAFAADDDAWLDAIARAARDFSAQMTRALAARAAAGGSRGAGG